MAAVRVACVRACVLCVRACCACVRACVLRARCRAKYWRGGSGAGCNVVWPLVELQRRTREDRESVVRAAAALLCGRAAVCSLRIAAMGLVAKRKDKEP